MRKVLLVVFGVLLMVTNSYSAQTCSGKISGVSIASAGSVYATVKSSTSNLTDVVFCELNATGGSYSGKSCNGILSLLLSGEAMNKTATLWFEDSKFSNCTQSWKGLSEFGFYHFKIN